MLLRESAILLRLERMTGVFLISQAKMRDSFTLLVSDSACAAIRYFFGSTHLHRDLRSVHDSHVQKSLTSLKSWSQRLLVEESSLRRSAVCFQASPCVRRRSQSSSQIALAGSAIDISLYSVDQRSIEYSDQYLALDGSANVILFPGRIAVGPFLEELADTRLYDHLVVKDLQ